jgi:hypothetical protein
MMLTQSTLFCLLYGKGDRREQFDQDLYGDLGDRRGGWDLCIDVEAPQEGFKRLKKVHKCIVARANILDCLMEATAVTTIFSKTQVGHIRQKV